MAKNPSPSLLDPGQIVKRAFDETTDRIRVETEIATVTVGGSQEILITDDVDSIKIGDGSGHYLAVNADGSINVTGSSSLPSGAATSAKQDTGNVSLASIDTKLSTVHTDLTKNYALQLDNTSTSNVTYIGKADIGSATSSAVWQIKKIDETSGLVITWAGTSDSFTNIWNNRTSLSYG